MTQKTTDVSQWPVMPAKCSTCPFGPNGDAELAARVTQRVLSEASQMCHHPRIHGKPETHLCRGARDVQLHAFAATGFIESPTDAAWAAKVAELRADQHDSGRAQRGGQVGVNGEHYAGGQFLPANRDTVKGAQRASTGKRTRPRRVQIEPGKWAECPPGKYALLSGVGHYLIMRSDGTVEPYMPACNAPGLAAMYKMTNAELLAMAQDEARRFNAGERWGDLTIAEQ